MSSHTSHRTLTTLLTLLSCLLMGRAVAQTVLTVDLESDKVKRYLDAVTYTYGSASRISSYAGTDEDERPNPVVFELPHEAPAGCFVHIANDNDDTDSVTVQIEEGRMSVEVYNLTPRQSYTYYIKSAYEDGCIDEGKVKTEGRVRMLYTPTIHNIRDMGGWRTADGQDTTRYRLIIRGSAPSVGDEADRAELVRLGIKAELDMRNLTTTPTESSLGPDIVYKYVYIEDLWESYVPTQSAQLKECFEFVVDNLRQQRPVYIHCTYGADRTGVLAAMIESCIGVSVSNVYKDYELTSFADTYAQNVLRDKNKINARLMTGIGFRTGKNLQQTMRTYMVDEMGISQQDIDDLTDIMFGRYKAISTGASTISVRAANAATYDLAGRRFGTPSATPRGIVIQRQGDGSVRKIVR